MSDLRARIEEALDGRELVRAWWEADLYPRGRGDTGRVMLETSGTWPPIPIGVPCTFMETTTVFPFYRG